MRSIGLGFVLAAMVLVPVKAEEGATPPNLLITFTVGRIAENGDVPLKSYSLLATGSGEQVEMMTGARVPIPTTTSGDGPDKSVTSFVYQNVGFTAHIEALVLPDGKIKLSGNIEDSSLAESPHSRSGPIIQTLHQHISAILENGVPVRINSVEETDTRSLYIEMKAVAESSTGG